MIQVNLTVPAEPSSTTQAITTLCVATPVSPPTRDLLGGLIHEYALWGSRSRPPVLGSGFMPLVRTR